MAERGRSSRSISVQRDSIADLEKADANGDRRWITGAKGAIYGLLFSGAVAVVLSLVTPLPENLPGVGAVRVVDNSRESGALATEQSTQEAVTPSANTSATSTNENATSASDDSAEDAQTTVADGDNANDASAERNRSATDASKLSQSTEPNTVPGSDAVSEEQSSASNSTATAETEGATAATDQASDADQSVEVEQATDTDQGIAAPEVNDSAQTDERPSTNDTAQTDTEADAPSTDEAQPARTNETSEETTEVAAITPAEIGPPPDPVSIELSGPALTVNARSFDVPSDAPLMAVVLSNATSGAIAPDALPLLTMPLTFSIVPNSPSDRAFALSAREAQHEVLSQIPVQSTESGGTADQILTVMDADRIALEVNARMAVLDMAVGATMPGDAFGASDPALLAAAIDTIEQHGFAFLDSRPGLVGVGGSGPGDGNVRYVSADRLVPAGATTEQIYEILETSAYRAQRQGSAIVVLDSSQEALQALLQWGLQRDRRPVWFAPISAVIAKRTETN